MSEKEFNQFLSGKENDKYRVIFPYPNLRDHLKIPTEGNLKDIVNHFKDLAEIIGKVGFQWEIRINENEREVMVCENKSQGKYIDEPIELLCEREKED